MKIKINLKIFIFLLIFILTNQIKIYAIIMLFALIHEFGHLFMGLFVGFRPESISITPFGFSIDFKVESYNYNNKIKKGKIISLKKILISLAGPLVNILFCIYYIIIQKSYIFNIDTYNLIYANILLAIFNLIPIYPLDGGRILKEIINIFYGLEDSYKFTRMVSKISIIFLTAISSVAILIFKNISIIIILVYLWYLAIKTNKQFELKEKIIKKIKALN